MRHLKKTAAAIALAGFAAVQLAAPLFAQATYAEAQPAVYFANKENPPPANPNPPPKPPEKDPNAKPPAPPEDDSGCNC